MAKDFLDEIIAQRTRKNPRFPDLVAEAERRRAIARANWPPSGRTRD
jgi:hypothetical protein